MALALSVGPDGRAAPKRTVRTVKGIEAMRLLYQRGDYARAAHFGYAEVWKDVRRPDVLLLIGSSLERLGKQDDAAVYYTLALRTLAHGKTADPALSRKRIEARLARVNAGHRQRRAEYARTAAGKRFSSPGEVSDLWMSQVTCDLHCLHTLYAWKLVGGRKDFKGKWIHDEQGRMHRSGAKYVNEVDGRRGVLFSVPIKAAASKDADKWHRAILDRLGHPTQITTRNPARCRFLRIGTKAYNFPYLLKVYRQGEEIFSQKVGTQTWVDLKIDLAGPPTEAATRPASRPAPEGEPFIIELVVPEGQRCNEGVWIDYMDFFEN
jgi:hypothetical protein